jgi:anti-sigma B factor antagonist
MKFNVDQQERYTIFRLEDEKLNSIAAPVLKSELVLIANKGVTNLIMDLSKVEFVDSSGLSAILTADRLWKNLGSFILVGIEHPSVKKLIKISRLDTVLTIIPTVSEAIDYVFMEELSRELNDEEE